MRKTPMKNMLKMKLASKNIKSIKDRVHRDKLQHLLKMDVKQKESTIEQYFHPRQLETKSESNWLENKAISSP